MMRMRRWRSPSTSRRTVRAELKGGGCPLSREERAILAKLKEQDEQQHRGHEALPSDGPG